MCAAFSPIMMAAALGAVPTTVGMTEASATRSPLTLRTRRRASTTLPGSWAGAILQRVVASSGTAQRQKAREPKAWERHGAGTRGSRRALRAPSASVDASRAVACDQTHEVVAVAVVVEVAGEDLGRRARVCAAQAHAASAAWAQQDGRGHDELAPAAERAQLLGHLRVQPQVALQQRHGGGGGGAREVEVVHLALVYLHLAVVVVAVPAEAHGARAARGGVDEQARGERALGHVQVAARARGAQEGLGGVAALAARQRAVDGARAERLGAVKVAQPPVAQLGARLHQQPACGRRTFSTTRGRHKRQATVLAARDPSLNVQGDDSYKPRRVVATEIGIITSTIAFLLTLPRGQLHRWSFRLRQLLGSGSVRYCQSTSVFWSARKRGGTSESGGGSPPASSSSTDQSGFSERRAATAEPADPAPTTTKS
ncbi:uncharacterized protein GBIM_19936 [Gryllus bimaculatus]|nr:uncharacterized protein GBIM_19936 [Gryllus bimaculatus]